MTPEQAIRQQLMQKYQAAQDDTGIQKAREDAETTDLISGIGSALTQAAYADAQSRGGSGPDLSSFQGMSQKARQAIKDAVEARQGKINNVLGEVSLQKGFADADRAAQSAQLAQDQFAFQKGQTDLQNKLSQDKLALDKDQFNQRLGLEKEKAGQEKILKEQELNAKMSESGKKVREQSRKESMDLTKQYMDHPTTKSTNIVVSNYDKIKALAENAGKLQTGAGDMGLVFSYMKMLDPGSTVREGEYANAQNSGGVDEKFRNLYNAVAKGQILSPGQRADFLKAAETLKTSQLDSQKAIYDQYSGIAGRYELDAKQAFGDAPQSPPAFPKTVINQKTGQKATVSNEAELKEATAEGFQ